MVPTIDVRADDRAVTITFNGTEKRSALNREMAQALQDALTAHERTPLPVIFRSSTAPPSRELR